GGGGGGTWARGGAPHRAGWAWGSLDGGRGVSGGDGGQESAFLLTSFGIAVPPLLEGELAPLPLADVFVVNGPGFATGIDVVTSEMAAGREILIPKSEIQGSQPSAGSGEGDAAPLAGERSPAADGSTSGKPAAGATNPSGDDATPGTQSQGEAEAGAAAAETEAATARLRLGLGEALRNLPDAAGAVSEELS